MGSCISLVATNSDDVKLPPTAMVIASDGAPMEYSNPVAASDVLGGDGAACFLCSSDGLYYGEYIPALDPEELLQPGQIYFVLPYRKLRFPLSGKDMAALVVKASSALGLLPEGGGRRSWKIRLMLAQNMEADRAGSGCVVGREMERSEENVRPKGAACCC